MIEFDAQHAIRCDADELYVIADIHANLPALQAVLNTIPKSATIVSLGDMVDYYSEPNEVCAMLLERDVYCLSGNHDLYVTEQLPYAMARDSLYRTTWTRSTLTPFYHAWITTLPSHLYFSFSENFAIQRIIAHHGNFFHPERYVYPDDDFDLNQFGNHTLGLLGHTHHPMIRQNGSSFLVNPGSVGQPRDLNPKASYAKINLHYGTAEIKRVSYDAMGYQNQLRQQHLESKAIDILSRVKK